MSENTDTLKRGYDAFNSGDIETLSGVFAEDVRWEGSNDERVPGAGTHDGRDDVLNALGQATEPFESIKSSPDEWIEDGDRQAYFDHLSQRAARPEAWLP